MVKTVATSTTLQESALGELAAKIEVKEALIGVVGLGYVGLPVACSFANAGFAVIGVDVKSERVAAINRGICPIAGKEPGLAALLEEVVTGGRLHAETEYRMLAKADVVLVDVETPVDSDHRPSYTALRAACRSLGSVLKQGALVVVESTIAPGTIDKIVGPLLEETSGGLVNRDFYLGACPERVMPGKLLANIRAMSRVCGGATPETAEVMVTLYRHVVDADLDVADPTTAALVKTVENAYRDVQIAFANEVALICETAGADVWRVRELVNKSPGRAMLFPGAGVGGHCIPKDSWLLAHGANEQVPIRLIPQARAVNDSMPLHIADLTIAALKQAAIKAESATVLVMGYAYIENSDDTRNSPSRACVMQLRKQGVSVVVHDPWVTDYRGDVLEMAQGCDAVVVMVGHDAYRQLSLSSLAAALRNPLLIDGRRVFDRKEAQGAGFDYWGVGQGVSRS